MRLQQQQGRQPGKSPAFLSFALPGAPKTPPTEFRIFPAGEWSSSKGTFRFTARSADLVLAAAKEWGNRFSVDYEHRALAAMFSGTGEAPAAGWFDLEVRQGELWAVRVEWTSKAGEYLKAGEYRYFSPAFDIDEDTQEVVRLVNLALTNLPATHDMEPLAASLRADGSTEAPTMKLLLKALNLSDTATEAEAIVALQTHTELSRGLLALTGKPGIAEALGAIQGWKVGAEKAAALEVELQKHLSTVRDVKVLSLIEEGKKSGKVPPTLVAFLTDLGRKDVAQLEAFLSAAAPVVTTTATAPKEGPAGTTVQLTSDETDVAAQLGLSAEDFAKHKALKEAELSKPGAPRFFSFGHAEKKAAAASAK